MRVFTLDDTLIETAETSMPLPQPSHRAPAFAIANHDGVTVTLDGLRGHRVLLWWYPKADTPG